MTTLAPPNGSVAWAQDRATQIIYEAEARAERIIQAARVEAEAEQSMIRERAWNVARAEADARIIKQERRRQMQKGR